MIITVISGGLGNQMFQYAIAKAIAHKREDEFKLDISFYPKQTLRKYELNFFNIDENIANNLEIKNIKGKSSLFSKVKKKLGLSQSKSFFDEKRLSFYYEDVFNYEENIYLEGYWQNEKYFLNIKDEILKDFSLKNEISLNAKKYFEEIKQRQSISIHIRRGDYIQNKHTNSVHGVCELDYYKKAINYTIEKIESPFFYIFSDDIDWCKKKFAFISDKCFVDDTKSAFDDLELMKNCKHNIIANSTFSWWGAWLNNNEAKIVIAPKQWFTDPQMQDTSKELIPSSWIKL